MTRINNLVRPVQQVVFATPLQMRTRLEVCEACEHKMRVMKLDLCSQCGCILDAKTKLKAATCPLGKW